MKFEVVYRDGRWYVVNTTANNWVVRIFGDFKQADNFCYALNTYPVIS